MISCYERSLFEQQTPYLQWLKERTYTNTAENSDINGKKIGEQISKLPFFSCEERIKDIVKISVDILKEKKFVLFYGEKGFLSPQAESFFADYFTKYEEVEIVYADEDYLGTLQELYGEKVQETETALKYRFGDTGLYRGEPWFKPEYSPDTLDSFFYFGHVFAIRGAVLSEMLQTEEVWEWSIYELVRKRTRRTEYAGHIAEVLFTNDAKVQEETENRRSKEPPQKGTDEKKELVSVLIPSKDNSKLLRQCLSTLVEVTDDPYYEIILIDNGSTPQELVQIREVIAQIQEDYELRWAFDDEEKHALSIQHIYQKADFNFSWMCNLGARAAKGKLLLFMNDDIEIIQPSWLRKMAEQAALSHVGAVGAKLYYPKAVGEETKPYRIQHAGITNMGIGPAHKLGGMLDEGDLYHGHNRLPYNMLAVTAACMMIEKERFFEVGGFDEELAVAYNDVELCFKLYEKGYYHVQRNDITLIHHESLTRGQDTSPEKAARLEQEKALLYKKHPLLKAKDPFYSEHLVQWKKDAAYHCHYLYPYDKMIMPVALSEAEIKKLPGEHENKYIRKLTGENLSMFELDETEVFEAEGTLLIRGWYVLREHDNAGIQRTLLLKNRTNGELYRCEISPKLRYDVEELFLQEAGGGRKRTQNVALAGIQCVIDKTEFTHGEYQIGIMITDETSWFKRKICWKKDCSVNV